MPVPHAPEPWAKRAYTRHLQVHDAIGCVVVVTTGTDFAPSKNRANVERIVACVNACAGIADPAAALAAARDALREADAALAEEDFRPWSPARAAIRTALDALGDKS
jgi:hypothetical protein